MAREAVAAGDGAFKTCIELPWYSIRKSSLVSPSCDKRSALTPALPGRISSDSNEGIIRYNVLRKSLFEKARRYSLIPKAILLKNNFQVPL